MLNEVAPQEHLRLIRIGGTELASFGHFAGAPALRINGTVIEPPSSGSETAAKTQSADLPSTETIRSAVLAAADGSPIQMPLRYRRILIIAALAILCGAVLGLLVPAGTVLTLTGIALVAVGLSNNGRRTGAQPTMWIAGASAALWLIATITYWAPVLFPGLQLPPSAAGIVFWCGVAGFVATILAVMAATILRMRLRRELTTLLN